MQSIPERLPTNCQPKWLRKLFSRIKEKDPPHVDRIFIQSVEGHFHEASVRKLALFLEVAKIDGTRGKNYDRLKDYPSNYFKRNLREIIFEKYSAFLDSNDLTTLTRESVVDKIMNHYQIEWDKARRAVNVLASFCRLADLPISDSLRIDAKRGEEEKIRKQRFKLKHKKEHRTFDEIRLTPRKVKRIARWIKSSRIHAGLEQKRLALRLGVYKEEVAQWENGAITPSKEMLIRISKVLNVNIDPKIINDLKEWVQKRREELGLSKEQLAQKAGLSTLTVYFIEKGRIENPTRITVSSLEKVLGKMPAELGQEVKEKRQAGEFDYSGPFPKQVWKDIVEKEGKIPCVYILYDKKKRPLYVGRTDDLKRRFQEHEKDSIRFVTWVEYFAYVVVKDEGFRKKMESVMIKVLGEDALFNIHDTI